MDPVFPTVQETQELHDEAQLQHGQNPEPLLNPGGLESALGRAVNHYHYGQGTPEENLANAAGALAHGVGMAQAFGDGNKRAAYYATHYFLHNNGYGHMAPPDDEELADHLIGHGEGTHTLEDTQNLFRSRLGGNRQANILDPIHPELASSVWDDPASPEPRLKAIHGHWLHKFIYHVLESNGYAKPHEWLHLVLTGSLTTYQYGEHSDVDVSLFVDAKVLPEWSRAEMIGLMIEHCDNVKLPGTPYPLQCFVVGKTLAPSDLYQPGMRSGYDIDANRWIVPPDPMRAHDVKAQENGFYVYALQMADKLERLQRYEPDKAEQFVESIHARRSRDMQAGKGDFSESNIIYKFLANRGLIPAPRVTARMPATLWHGTFSEPGRGSDFGGLHLGTLEAAKQRLDYTRASQRQGRPGGGRYYPATIAPNLRLLGQDRPLDETQLFSAINMPSIVEQTKRDYDGIMYSNMVEDPGSLSYLIFDPANVSFGNPVDEEHIGRTADWVDDRAVPYIEQEGGGTFHPMTGESPTTGYQVSQNGHTVQHPEAIIHDHHALGDALHQFIQQHQVMFRPPQTNYVGAWVENGQLWLEPSENVLELQEAIRRAKERNQIAIWDNANRTEIPTGGTGYDPTTEAGAFQPQEPQDPPQAPGWVLGVDGRAADGMGTRASNEDPGASQAARGMRYFIDHPQLGPGMAEATEQMGPVGPLWAFIPDNGGRSEHLHPYTEPADIERWAQVRKARLPRNDW